MHRQYQPITGRLAVDPNMQFHAAVVRELHRVGQKMTQQLANPRRIADQRLRQPRFQRREQLQSLRLRRQRMLVERRLQQLPQAELALLQRKLPRFQRRIFQRGVQNFEQAFRAYSRRIHVFALLLIQIGFQQQVRHPDDPAQRRSNFVVQAREK